MFSLHHDTANIGNERFYAKNWSFYNEADHHNYIARLALKFCVSPVHWLGGWRGRDRFIEANWIGLDFDNGMSLEDALVKFDGLTHVIGTTKHHRLQKGTQEACDRFRVFVQLRETIKDMHVYEYNVRARIKQFGADMSAGDAARKFNPCKTIVRAAKGVGLDLAVQKKAAQKVILSERSGIPEWARALLEIGVDSGVSRNTTCYKLGVHLTRAGMSISQIVEKIMASPIPRGANVLAEVERAVKRGSLKA